MPRGTAQSAALARAFAEAHQLSARAARWHRANNTPEWQAFQLTGPAAPAGGDAPSPPIAPADALPSELDRALALEHTTWQTLLIVQRLKARIEQQANPSPEVLASWIKAEKSGYEAHRHATTQRQQIQQKLGHLLPASELARLRTEFIGPLRDVLQSMETEVAAAANPLRPDLASAAIADFKKHRLFPVIEALREALPDAKESSRHSPVGGKGEEGRTDELSDSRKETPNAR